MVAQLLTGISFFILFSSPTNHSKENLTAQNVIDAIKSEVTCVWRAETVDTFKAGNPNDEVSGIVCTLTASMDVLKSAVENNCNLIITHEPTFYNHLDDTEGFINDRVYNEKEKFIRENRLIIFRFHDHWHLTNPDGIYVGMLKEMGWDKALVEGTHNRISVPGNTLSTIKAKLENTFPQANMRIIGDEDLKVNTIGFSAGAPGFDSHLKLLRQEDIDLLIIGEAREWETVEYVRDASQMGHKIGLIILGHAISEEAGMEYCAEWLQTFIKDIPVHFIEAGDPFN